MADKHHSHDHGSKGSPYGQSSPGTMDVSDHVKMWHSFWNTSKWGSIGIILIFIFLAIFRTHNGYN